MIRIAIRSALIAALAALSACGTTRNAADDADGKGGSQPRGDVRAAIVESLNGGLIGGSIGGGLSQSEKARALEAEYRALEYGPAGQAVSWKGEQASTFGEAVAAQPYRVGSQDCRQYTQTVFRGGQSRMSRGTACRNADGSWTLLS